MLAARSYNNFNRDLGSDLRTTGTYNIIIGLQTTRIFILISVDYYILVCVYWLIIIETKIHNLIVVPSPLTVFICLSASMAMKGLRHNYRQYTQCGYNRYYYPGHF